MLQKVHFTLRVCKIPGFMQRRIGPTVQTCLKSGLPLTMIPWLHQCILWSKWSYGNGEQKNVILDSVQKAHFAVRVSKISGFMQRRIRPTVYISWNLGLILTMLPWLHQCILYIKRKLREWGTQKCNPWFGTKSPLRSTGLQNTRFHSAPYSADSADFPKIGASFNHGTMIAPMHSLYQKEATGMENQKM